MTSSGGGRATPAQQVLARSADWGRAPSAHNTQPWHLTESGPDALALGWHPDRTLPAGDPSGRDLLLSLGAVAQAVEITACDLGLRASTRWRVDRSSRRAGLISLDRTPPVSPSPGGAPAASGVAAFTVAELRARRTARGPYAPPASSAEQIARIGGSADLPDGSALVALPADLVARALPVADRWTFDGPATAELREWLRLGRHRRDRDGLTAQVLGLRPWEAAVLRLSLSPALLPVLRGTRATRLLAASSTARPLGTVVALTAVADRGDDHLADLGRALLRTWLAAGREGLWVHPLSQLLDCPETARMVAAATAGTNRRVVAVFRLGVPRHPPPAARRLTD
ncbi:hypothetical protein [Georgenia faecalis]|uniref:Nitroreductase n=1 Tax=Georgenia faecalis TaxID=2483799 RepID=A0ABV9D762_9MICO|nr:hypothetical protein [Georgenia faecalis]